MASYAARMKAIRKYNAEVTRLRSVSKMQVTVIAGRPGSGKSTYVKDHMQPGDLLVDYDAIGMALSGQPPHHRSVHLTPFISAAEHAILRRLERPSEVERVWILTARPDPIERRALVARLAATLIELDVPPEECIARIQADPARPPMTDDFREYIERWEPT